MPLVNVVNQQHSDEAFLFLITITDPTSTEKLYGVSNLEPVTYRGQRFEAFPFEVILPPDDGTKPAGVSIQTVNTGPELMRLLRGTLEPPLVKLELILSSSLELPEDQQPEPEKTIDFMVVRSLSYNNETVSFELASSSIFARRTCSGVYSQVEFPGLFFALS